jgi:hypothetical protein
MKRRLGKVEILKFKKILNNGRNEGQGRWKIRPKWWTSWRSWKMINNDLPLSSNLRKTRNEYIEWWEMDFSRPLSCALIKTSRKSLTQEWRIKGFPKTLGKAIGNRYAQSSVVFALLTWLHITWCCWVYNACVRSVWHSKLVNSCTTKTVWKNSLAKKISTTFLKWGENNKLPGSQKFQYFALIRVHSHLMLSQC